MSVIYGVKRQLASRKQEEELNETEDTVINAFNNTIEKKDGRYQVCWPWRDENPDLPENYELSLGRLRSIRKKFDNNPELLHRYDAVIKDQLQKGIIEKVEDNNAWRKHYIPHHPIVNPDKATSKLRIVYDASAKAKRGAKSLNECLHRGPVILEDLCSLLLRFRTKKIGLIADIEKAFLQVGLQECDRDVTRFLWFKDINDSISQNNIETYRFTRAPFGVISSPFLLGATIRHHLEQTDNSTANQINDDIYVDNLVTGVNDEKQAYELYSKGKQIFKDASMNLRDWVSNSENFNKLIEPEDMMKEKVIKVLGLIWNTLTDKIQLSARKSRYFKETTTKREVFSGKSSIFDPLGLISPALLSMKLFLQDLWEKGKDWDEKLNSAQISHWKKIIKNVEDLTTLSIPRYVMGENARLLRFCDASNRAYATTLYLQTTSNGITYTNLIFSILRNSPKKSLTIPRMELLSVLIGVRSLQFVEKSLKISITQRVLWTDSQCVLMWIKGKENQSVFVRNRIKEISNTKDVQFRYINTSHNPADLPTRGVSVKNLKDNQLWWHGPEWLNQEYETWPTWNIPTIDLSKLENEESSSKQVLYEITEAVTEVQETITSPFNIKENGFSTLKKLLNVTSYVKRFIENTRRKDKIYGPPTPSELEESEIMWIKYLHSKHYLTPAGKLKDEYLKNQLNPTLHENGIVRVHGRLHNAQLSEDTITPILLPRGTIFTSMVIQDIHERLFHTGVSHTLAMIRYKYWIPQGRSEVKKVLRNCLVCTKHQGGPYKTKPMSPWPKTKVCESPAFTNTGLDYFGPLYVKNGNSFTKTWVCIFTCVAVRAIHLELVEDMSGNEFIEALRRFVSRRGKPKRIISDNAKQFKLAKNTIDLAWAELIHDPEVLSHASKHKIDWSFIVELSPWMGGFYERLIGVVKRCLRKSISKLTLTSSQLRTILAEIEAVVNTRPLVYVGEDIDQQTVITPAHFTSINPKIGIMIDTHSDELNDPNYTDVKKDSSKEILDKWKKGQRHVERFWQLWRNDYLLSLRERSQRYKKHPRIQSTKEAMVGDIVQIKDDTPRGTWKIGRITELIKSNDGEVRAAKVQLASKIVLQRSLCHLYPLECERDPGPSDIEIRTKEHVEQEGLSEQRVPHQRPTRHAAMEARDRILGHNLVE